MQTPTPEKTINSAKKLRYKVRAMLYALPAPDRIRIKKRILKDCELSESSFSRYINVLKTDTYDMPALVLLAFANLLNVEVEDLKN